MSTTTASTSDLTWAGVEVLYATDSSGGANVTLWTVPAAPTDAGAAHDADLELLRKVSDDHAQSVSDAGAWEAGPATELADGAGGSYLLRQLTRSTGTPDKAVAGYWTTPSGISVAVASHGDGETQGDAEQQPAAAPDLTQVLEDFVVASWPTFGLSAEEVLVLCQATDLAAPPVSPSSYSADSPEEVRTAANASALASLLARGLLHPADGRMQPPAALHAALRLLLDGDRSLLLSVQRPDGDSTTLLGGRDSRLAVLAPGEHGTLVLSTTGPGLLVRRYAAWLAPRDTARPAAAPSGDASRRASVDSLRAAVSGSADDASPWSGSRQLVSLRGLRRHGDDLSVLDSTWLEDGDGQLWSVTATEDPTMALLSPVDGSMISESLGDAVDFSTP